MYVDLTGDGPWWLILVAIAVVATTMTISGCNPPMTKEERIAEKMEFTNGSYTPEEALEKELKRAMEKSLASGKEIAGCVWVEEGIFYYGESESSTLNDAQTAYYTPDLAAHQTLVAIFHTHLSHKPDMHPVFSLQDCQAARHENVKSYILDIDGNLFEFDPATARNQLDYRQIGWDEVDLGGE